MHAYKEVSCNLIMPIVSTPIDPITLLTVAVDLNLVGYRFNWALSIFFIAYMLVEVPSNMLLSRFGPRYYIPALVVGFGFVSLCTAFTTSFAELCVARVFLGIFEGGEFDPLDSS